MVTIIEALAGRPLAIMPEALAGLLNIDDVSTPGASRFAGAFSRESMARVTPGGTGVLSVCGPLFNRGAILGENWGFSTYEGLDFKLRQMAADPKIKRVILDMDSPGGHAAGAFELAATIRAVNATKPVFAHVNALAASAGYALASGARAIVSAPSGESGSIGVVVAHVDISGALEKAGVGVSLVHAGKNKVDRYPYKPLSESAKAELQAEVDAFHTMFVETVAAGRGSRLTADAARNTEARIFLAADARNVGLIDEIGSFGELLETLERKN